MQKMTSNKNIIAMKFHFCQHNLYYPLWIPYIPAGFEPRIFYSRGGHDDNLKSLLSMYMKLRHTCFSAWVPTGWWPWPQYCCRGWRCGRRMRRSTTAARRSPPRRGWTGRRRSRSLRMLPDCRRATAVSGELKKWFSEINFFILPLAWRSGHPVHYRNSRFRVQMHMEVGK
jgi:hypothetical protein